MINWIKVWWHCFKYTITAVADHRICSSFNEYYPWKNKYFCSCGYNNNGVTIDEEVLKMFEHYHGDKFK